MKVFAIIAIALIAVCGFLPTPEMQASVGTAGRITAFCVIMWWFADTMGLR